jgi:hypothetical protein
MLHLLSRQMSAGGWGVNAELTGGGKKPPEKANMSTTLCNGPVAFDQEPTHPCDKTAAKAGVLLL